MPRFSEPMKNPYFVKIKEGSIRDCVVQSAHFVDEETEAFLEKGSDSPRSVAGLEWNLGLQCLTLLCSSLLSVPVHLDHSILFLIPALPQIHVLECKTYSFC
jgi:hypothetical protein